MTTTTDLKLEVSRHVPHAPERVFDAWLEAAMLARFMCPAEGVTVPEATSDAVEGGRFRIVMRTPEGKDLPHAGTYKTLNRARQLVFSWESPMSNEDSLVTIDLAPARDGTDIRLTHVRFLSQEMRDNHEKGWTTILARLEDVL